MLSAAQFIDADVNQPQEEKKRLSMLFESIANQNIDEKKQLVNEFLNIILNKDENIARRAQAANILGAASRALDIKGATWIAESLLEVLRHEFLQENLEQRLKGKMDLLFLDGIVTTVLLIDFGFAFDTVNAIFHRLEGTGFELQLARLLEITKPREK